jgi:hypothetical protein
MQGREYDWFGLYLAAIVEADPEAQMQCIAVAVTSMSERSDALPTGCAESAAIQNARVVLESMQRRAAEQLDVPQSDLTRRRSYTDPRGS